MGLHHELVYKLKIRNINIEFVLLIDILKFLRRYIYYNQVCDKFQLRIEENLENIRTLSIYYI